MNSLSLRISNGGGRKAKNVGGFSPVDVTEWVSVNLGAENNVSHNFMIAATVEEQLQLLRKYVSKENVAENANTIAFLVKVFFNTEAKHPVKCFLARHITKNLNLHQPFTNTLSQELIFSISTPVNTYKDYLCVVSKLASCIENFQPGCAAVKREELSLSCYLNACLRCCVDTLKTQSLSPTEKNEIFNLSHLALRLLLHIIQRASEENIKQLDSVLNSIKSGIQELLFDQDVPMDAKSVCGILFLTIYLLEEGQEAWVHLLHPRQTDDQLTNLLSNDASQLSLFSAVATVAAIDRLQSQTVNGESALIILSEKILDIGERCSSESIFTLGVTRTVVQISQQLDKLTDNKISLKLVENLLTFVWGHLEHYMDSVRHLTAQMLSNIVKFCSRLDRDGYTTALSNLFTSVKSLDKDRKSYFVSLTALTKELGATKVLSQLDLNGLQELIKALNQQAVQASVTTTLETLLQKYVQENTAQAFDVQWVQPILDYLSSEALDSSVVVAILEKLLVKAVKQDENLIEIFKRYLPMRPGVTTNLKCSLMLTNVVRKSGVSRAFLSCNNNQHSNDMLWKGLISYDTLEAAAVNSSEETRILSLSLIVESPKTTEPFNGNELNFILTFLKYNINAQSPNFRQLTLSMMKKCFKRLEDSLKSARRQAFIEMGITTGTIPYIQFVECLRHLCFNSLLPGANYSRRFVALQLLVWCEQISLDGQHRTWTEEYIEKLLIHLEDSYENNKAFALDILNKCPARLLKCKKYSVSLEFADILKQASSLKPTDCISAAYKLDLLRTKLPDSILNGDTCSTPEPVAFTLLHKLHTALQSELSVCQRSVVCAAVNAPMYGLLHCMVHLVTKIDVKAISTSEEWTSLIRAMISTCVGVSAGVAVVVNNSSPEGHLPMDLGGVTDHGNAGGVTLDDGRQVTAQMVLLCAWRSVKEVSLLLGEISSRLLISGEDVSDGTLTPDYMVLIGEHFTKLLAETKHRGAFEQAYVGFTKLLTRLWRCRSPSLSELPRRWLSELMALIARGGAGGEGGSAISTTRRGAGLPFMIQALVTTELQAHGNAKCFHDSMTTLLRLARTPKQPSSSSGNSEPNRESLAENVFTRETEAAEKERDASACKSETDVETRTHCLNILRALFRNSALDESVAGYVQEGFMVALEGFEGRTWMERNASTLLFSALMVRVFGVQRARDAAPGAGAGANAVCARNRMTGRIFFLRYPRLYDFMLTALAARAPAAVGSGPPAAVGSGPPAAVGSGPPAAVGSGPPAAVGSGPPAAVGSGPPAAVGSGPPAAVGSGPPAAVGSGPPAAVGSGPPAAVGSGPPAAVGSGPPAAVGSGPPAAVGSGPPAAVGSGPPAAVGSGPPAAVGSGPPAAVGSGPPPALFPVLLLLARLYPSSLEGTVSNLKLSAFVEPVCACAASGVLAARRLAARALPPLVGSGPSGYVDHLITTLGIINAESHPKFNHIHGLLLQLTELLRAKPVSLRLDESSKKPLQQAIRNSLWILRQACGDNPCYLLADEWIKMINLFLWKFPSEDLIPCHDTQNLLQELLLKEKRNISPGREICLSSGAYLCFIMIIIEGRHDYNPICNLLLHQCYEVTLAALNSLIMAHGRVRNTYSWMDVLDECEPENDFEEHMATKNWNNFDRFRSPTVNTTLCEVLKRSKHLECQQKALKLLVMMKNAEQYIVANKICDSTITDDVIVQTLTDCLDSEHESLAYLYLKHLSEFVTKTLKQSTMTSKVMLGVLRTMFDFSSCDTSEAGRSVVAGFIWDNLKSLHGFDLSGLSQKEQFEFKTTLYATILILLEDDNASLRQKISSAITALNLSIDDQMSTLTKSPPGRQKTFQETDSWVISTKSAEVLMDFIKKEKDQAAMFITFALLDFKSQVCMSDEIGDECRVFDQNEKYNIYAEESVWTDACANEIILICRLKCVNPTDFVLNIIRSEPYKGVIKKLCNSNVVSFEKMLSGECTENPDVNPKIRLFVCKLETKSISQTRCVKYVM